MNLIYQVKDKPKFGANLIFALQQLLAILAATIAVPSIIGNGMSQSAALFGAGVGTIVYLLFTKFRSPVFLGSSFAFLGSMAAAFAGAVSVEVGYLGLIIGAILAGLVYVVIAILVKIVGVEWLNKLMPAVVIGPTVAIIGLSLAGNAVGDLQSSGTGTASVNLCILCGLVTLFVTILCSTFGKKMARLIPFIIGILAGYAVAAVFTVIGTATGNEALKVINFSVFNSLVEGGVGLHTFFAVPEFTFIKALGGFSEITGQYIGTIAAAYVPVALVVFAEHVADHKNISSIIGKDLLKDPGLSRTLLGDGLATTLASLFGAPANTTYGENTGVLALSRVYDPRVIRIAACIAIVVSFCPKFAALVSAMPTATIGGVSLVLYGMISAVGVRNVVENKVDFTNTRNVIIAALILVLAIGITYSGSIQIGVVSLSGLAVSSIVGILLNAILPGNDYEFDAADGSDAATSGNLQV